MKRVALIQHENQPDEALSQAVYKATLQAIIRSFPDCAVLSDCDDTRLRLYIAQQKPAQVITTTDVSHEIAETLRDEKIVLVKLGRVTPAAALPDIVIDPLAGPSTDSFAGPAFLPAAVLSQIDAGQIAAWLGLSIQDLTAVVDSSRVDSALADILSLVAKLKWDSAFFGFGVGRVTCLRLTESIEARVRQKAADQDLRFIEFRCGSGDRLSVTTAEAHRYSLADTRVTFELKNPRANGDDSNRKLHIAVAREEDIDALVSIGSDLYRDSRYYFDGGFEEETLRAFYGTWIRNGVLGTFDDFALALYDNGCPIGFCTVKLQRGHSAAGRIGLFGLSRDHHGMGLGAAFLRASVEWLAKDGVTSLEVVTQGRNVAAQRLYQRAGFLTKRVELTYHKWLK
ncbi:MAG: GNAT family N-acetyltransferase [Bryobacterales bacterium]|nr:GNAT family N-acetyltransferase [Bryobacterales bacterium]